MSKDNDSFNATDESYQIGHEAGLDALEALGKSGASEHAALAGLLAVVMHATYAMAPSEKIADDLIEFSQEQAIENWVKQEDAR